MQADAAAAALAPDLPDLEALMQEWSPAMQAHIAASPLPDPRQVRGSIGKRKRSTQFLGVSSKERN
jgi:hypothetical protein